MVFGDMGAAVCCLGILYDTSRDEHRYIGGPGNCDSVFLRSES